MNDFAMPRTCAECPFLVASAPGKFPPSRYQELAHTCAPGGLSNVFACHMTPNGEERACAGMVLVCGHDINSVRLAVIRGRLNPTAIKASGPLYRSYRAMAEANGCDLSLAEFDELRD